MVYSDFAIDQLLRRLAEAWNRTSTPRRLAGDLLEAIEVIRQLRTKAVPPPNEPLTLEELRKLEGEPVWVTHKDGSGGRWGIINIYPQFGICADVKDGKAYWFDDGVGSIAYRRRPEEGTQ